MHEAPAGLPRPRRRDEAGLGSPTAAIVQFEVYVFGCISRLLFNVMSELQSDPNCSFEQKQQETTTGFYKNC